MGAVRRDPDRGRGPGRRHAARPGARARGRRRGRGRRDRLARTAATSCGTRPPTCSRRRSRTSTPRPSSASARRSPTASTTTSTSPSPSCPADLEKIETRMRKIVKEGQRFSRRPVSDDDALSELAEEPYKLELIGLKGGSTSSTTRTGGDAEGASVEVGAGELTIYDNLTPRRVAGVEGPVPRPAPADHQADPGLPADAVARRRTGAATRRTSSCSGSTAPPGSPRRRSRSTCTASRRPSSATTASSAASWTSSASPTSSAPAWPCSTPRAA